MNLVKNRPAELGSFFIIAPAIYGWLVEVHVDNLVAALVACVAGLVPGVISWVRDGFPAPDDPGDSVASGLPEVKRGKHERIGLNHERS